MVHLQDNGFQVEVREVTNQQLTQVKAQHGVTRELQSCHTGLVDGYVIEGHVPADVITRLLKERPDVKGLAVPGMPMGSPGMEGAYSEPYDILTFDEDGNTTVYASR